MRRPAAGTSIRAAESNSVSPSSEILPRSGLSSPAIMLIRLVLPAPEGPNRTVAPLSLANSAFTENSPSFFSTSTVSILGPVQTRLRTAGEPFRRDQGGERNDDGDDHQRERSPVSARYLPQRVDRRRNGLRLAGYIGDVSDGGAELTERAGKGQHHAGDDAGQRQRQRDGEEQPHPVGAQGRCGVFQPPIDRFDREPDRAHHQRKRHHTAGQGRPGPAE